MGAQGENRTARTLGEDHAMNCKDGDIRRLGWRATVYVGQPDAGRGVDYESTGCHDIVGDHQTIDRP